jgi:hypothetical protein
VNESNKKKEERGFQVSQTVKIELVACFESIYLSRFTRFFSSEKAKISHRTDFLKNKIKKKTQHQRRQQKKIEKNMNKN